MDFSPPGFSVQGILQARILDWVAIPFSRKSSQLRDRTQVSCTTGKFWTTWATREAHKYTNVYGNVHNGDVCGYIKTKVKITHSKSYNSIKLLKKIVNILLNTTLCLFVPICISMLKVPSSYWFFQLQSKVLGFILAFPHLLIHNSFLQQWKIQHLLSMVHFLMYLFFKCT